MQPRSAICSGLSDTPTRLLALISLAPAIFGISLLFDESVVWMNHEYLIFSLPGALLNGIQLKWADLFRGFDPLLFDVVRPRFINYVVTIFNVKLRLLTYEYFIPRPGTGAARVRIPTPCRIAGRAAVSPGFHCKRSICLLKAVRNQRGFHLNGEFIMESMW